jgi:ankyrin repeat protein
MALSPDSTAHHTAVERGDWAAVLSARKAGVGWGELTTRQGVTALHQALLRNEALIVENFLAREAPCAPYRLPNGTLQSPLWDAVERGQDRVATALLHAGADPQQPSPHGEAPPLLRMASEQGMVQTCLALLARGVRLTALKTDDRIATLEGLLTASQAMVESQGVALLQALEVTGWVPDPEERNRLEAALDTAQAHASPGLLAALEHLRGHWRVQHILQRANEEPATGTGRQRS